MKTIVTLACLALCVQHPSAAQRRDVSECEQSLAARYACVLRGGGVGDLRDAELRAGDREIRFWTEASLGDPESIMVIRQRGDSVTGGLLLIWSPGAPDEFVTQRCGRRWTSTAGMLCTGTLQMEPDWRKLLALLDSLGMAQMPSSPVRNAPCKPFENSGGLACPTTGDGIFHWLETAETGLYWRYDFLPVRDPQARHLRRDTSILEVLKCASRLRGEGLPCEGIETRIR